MAPKAKMLTLDALATIPAPQAATPARTPEAQPAPQEQNVPLQLRIPRAEARAIRVRAAELEMSISDYVLMCVRGHEGKKP